MVSDQGIITLMNISSRRKINVSIGVAVCPQDQLGEGGGNLIAPIMRQEEGREHGTGQR